MLIVWIVEFLLEFIPVDLVNTVLSLLYRQTTYLAHVFQQLLVFFVSLVDASYFDLLVE